MVHGVVAPALRVEFEQGEIDHPKRGKLFGLAQAQPLAQFHAEHAQAGPGYIGIARQDADKVTRGGPGDFSPPGQVFGPVEFVDRRFEGAVFQAAHIDHARGPYLRPFHPVNKCVDLLAGIGRAPGYRDTDDQLGLVEYPEVAVLGHGVQFPELHPEADIGFVRAVPAYRLVIGHPREGPRFDSVDCLQQMAGKPFKGIQDIVLLHKGHLAVDLGEFGLPVGAQVFVAEAFDDLEIFVHAAHHQQLLKGLGRLGKGVELPRVEPARHHEIAGALGGRFDQVGGFDLHEPLARKVIPHFQGYPGPEQQLAFHGVPPDIEVAVFHPQLFAPVGLVFDRERRGKGGVEHLERLNQDLDRPGGQLRVLGRPFHHGATGLYHKLPAYAPRLLQKPGLAALLVQHQLGDAVAVAQVDPDYKSLVADLVCPAREQHGLADMRFIEFPAGM